MKQKYLILKNDDKNKLLIREFAKLEHDVYPHELWYRYMPESGNWHGGTFTRWIAALSAAPQILTRLQNKLSRNAQLTRRSTAAGELGRYC